MKSQKNSQTSFWNRKKTVEAFGKDQPSREILDFINSLKIPRDSNILDLGCGAGRNLIPIVKFGYNTYGIDTSEEMLRYTQKSLKKIKLEADIRREKMDDLSFENDFFSVVISNGVFHQAKDIKEYIDAIAEIERITKKNGLLYVNIFTLDNNIINNYKKVPNKKYSYYTGEGLITTFLPEDFFEKILMDRNFVRMRKLNKSIVNVSTGRRTVYKAIYKHTS